MTTKKIYLALFSSQPYNSIKKRERSSQNEKGQDMQTSMQQSSDEQSSSIEYDFCRQLTSVDVDRALYALGMNYQRPIGSDSERSNVSSRQDHSPQYSERFEPKQCDCCRLLRMLSPSRLLLPLARRGRPHLPTRSHHLLCPTCSEIKRQQQIEILQTVQKRQSYHTAMTFDTSSNENTIALSSNPNSLTDQERKMLLEETIRKLQVALNNQPTIRDYDQDNFQFTYRTLQTTLDILSSSDHPI